MFVRAAHPQHFLKPDKMLIAASISAKPLLCAAFVVMPIGVRAQANAPALNAATPAQVGRWTCRWARGGIMAQYDQVPLLRGGNVQLFSATGRGLYGAGEHPPACRVETLSDGGRAYITRYRYEAPADTNVPDTHTPKSNIPAANLPHTNNSAPSRPSVFEAEQRIEVHPANRITLDIRARWNGSQPVQLEWNPLRVWAYALVGAQYTSQANLSPPLPSQTRTNGVVTPMPQNNAPQTAPPQNTPTDMRANGAGRIGWKPRVGPLAAMQLSPGWQRLALTHTGVGDITLTTSVLDEQAASDGAAKDASNQDAIRDKATGSDAANAPNVANEDLPVLYDGRADANLSGDRIFWGGTIGAKITPGREYARRITLTVAAGSPTSNVLAASAPPSSTPDSTGERDRPTNAPAVLPTRLLPLQPDTTPTQNDPAGHPLIIPTPKQARYTGKDFVIGKTLTICADPPVQYPKGKESGKRPVLLLPPSSAGPLALAELHRFADELHARTGTVIRFTRSPSECDLNVFVAPASPQSSNSEAMQAAPDKKEGYRLLAQPGRIRLMGSDPAGAFYGLQTLRQLLVRRPDGRYAIRGADIRDWPSLRFRGAHIFVGRHALPFHKKLIERIFARYKMNALVIECEYTAWKSHPELHVPNSMPPDDLRQEVAFARAHFVEPIPLVNSLGHSQWLFANKQHLDLCEDPARPYAYNAGDPATYRLLFDIYGETLDIFKPRYFHIGHDEVKIPGEDTFGRYPARPDNIHKGVTRLFVDDTNRLADWLRARGARTMLWADMLLHESEGADTPDHPNLSAANAPTLAEAQSRRAQMPRDAILADWRYATGSEQRNGLQILQKAGFQTLGCAWYEPGNIAGWARQATKNNALGTLQTTWAGYDSNESLLETEYKQFTAYILAAQAAWTGGSREDEADFDAAQVFARAYRDEGANRTRTGWQLDLRPVANVQIAPNQAEGGFPITTYTSKRAVETAATKAQSPPARTDAAVSGGTADTKASVHSETASSQTLPAGILLRGALNPLNTLLRDASLSAEGQTAGGDIRKAQAAGSEASGSEASAGRTAIDSAIRLSVRARAGTLVFEHACAYGAERGANVAAYTVVYADGKRAVIPLRYGYEIRALDDATPSDSFSTQARTISMGKASASFDVTLRRLRWTNPSPDTPIDRIEFQTNSPVAAPILFGVTGLY